MSDGRFIYDLDQTTDQLGDNDKIIIEKADGSGTMIMTYKNFINSVTATILKNNGTTTASGYALDARYGKTLNDGTQWLYGVTAISENANLNTYTTVGEYFANNAAGTSASNTPYASAFRLTVEKMQNSSRADLIRQTLRPYGSNDTWVRYTTNTGTSWSTWETPTTALVRKRNLSYSYTIGANGNLTVTAEQLELSAIPDYTPIGIISYNTGDNNIVARGVFSNTSGNVLILHNLSASAISTSCSVIMLFIKSTAMLT